MPTPSPFVPPPPVAGQAPAPPTLPAPPVLTAGEKARHAGLSVGLLTGAGLGVYAAGQGWAHGVLGLGEGLGLVGLAAVLAALGLAAAWPFWREIQHDRLQWQGVTGYHRATARHHAAMQHGMLAWVARYLAPRPAKAEPGITINGETPLERAVHKAVARGLAGVNARIDALQETPDPARYTPAAVPVPAHYTLITPLSHQITPGDQPTQPLGRVPYTATMQTLIDRALTRQAISIRVCKEELDMHAVDWKAATAALQAAGVLVKRTDRGEGFTLADGLHTEADVRRRLGGV